MISAILPTLALVLNAQIISTEWQTDGTVEVSVTIDIKQASDGYIKAPAELEKAATKACEGKGKAKRISNYKGESGESADGQQQMTLTATYECV